MIFGHVEYGCNSNNDNNNNVNPRTTKLDWRSSSIRVKVIGTLISIMGAIFVQVYKGPSMRKAASDDKLEAKINPPLLIFYSTPDRWVLGSTLLAASSLSVCVWNIIQVKLLINIIFHWSYDQFILVKIDHREKRPLNLIVYFTLIWSGGNYQTVSPSDESGLFL